MAAQLTTVLIFFLMAASLNKVGGSLWNAHHAHNEAAAAKIKAKIPLFNTHNNTMEDERAIMKRLMPSHAVGCSAREQVASSSLASQLHANLHAKNTVPSTQSTSTTTTTTTTSKSQPHRGALGSGGNNQAALLTSMASRLTALEKSHRMLRTELVQKEREVLEWKRKYESIAEAANDDGVVKAAEQMQEMQRANLQLRNHVHEMESFLQDYGLIWVGAAATGNAGSTTTSSSSTTATTNESLSANIGRRIDFVQFFRRLEELNHLAGDGKASIVKNGRNARFQHDPEKISLSVFQDGLFIRRGPFRPFADTKTQRFVSDVLDGYFPPEFKDDYPNGIIFDVKDNTSNTYDSAVNAAMSSTTTGENHFTAFGGQGNKIGGDSLTSMSREEFLSRLPEKMITKGRVVSIRDSIASKLDGVDEEKEEGNSEDLSSNTVKIGATPALSMLQRSATRGELHADDEVTTLRIKTLKGGSLLLKMYFADTIGDLRAHVAQNMAKGRTSKDQQEFDLRTSYPSRIFRDDDITLLEAGLTPNAALIVQASSSRK